MKLNNKQNKTKQSTTTKKKPNYTRINDLMRNLFDSL